MKKIKLPLILASFFAFGTINTYAQDYYRTIKDHLNATKAQSFSKPDLANFSVISTDEIGNQTAKIVKIHQTYNDLLVYGAVGTAVIDGGKVTYLTENFEKKYTVAYGKTPSISKKAAFDKIASLLSLEPSNYHILDFYAPEPADILAAKQRLVYVKTNEKLALAYEFLIEEEKSPSYWSILVDAVNGDILKKTDLNLSCNFHHDPYNHDVNHLQDEETSKFFMADSESGSKASSLLAPNNASYNVFPLPVEAPTFGSRAVVTNPYDITASPEGWHNTGTTAYTITRGNNVHAYEDRDGLNSTPGASPDGGPSRIFNFPYDAAATPVTNLDAALTNLFYINNKVHDIFYKFGFNEVNRNFQTNNFGNGGLGNDYVRAEGQDRSGWNNANFATPADGQLPRMQMYLWTGSSRHLWYNAPADAIPRTPTAGTADFGASLDDVGVTANVKLSPVLDACTALPTGSMTGFIGLVERGTCAFTVKVKNVQNAGAVAAIIYNNAGGTAVGGMTGTDNTITIPSVIIDNPEGEFIKSKLAANIPVNITLKLDVRYDGNFDNGIVIHEYGHGISNRLTGDGYTCLSANNSREQMGEGWSDFFALMLTNKPGDNASVARGIGTYAAGQPITGNGIRPARYTPDMSVNGFTYGMTNGMEYTNSQGVLVPDVHSIGFIWATILWDLHWSYAAKYGYSADVLANMTNGSSRILKIVTDALKLQPCSPDFVTGRDAILQADLLATGGQDKCMIWRAFARRGVGLNADPGVPFDINDQTEDFTLPAECPLLATSEVNASNEISIYPNPAKNEFFITFPNNTLGKATVEVYDASGKLVMSESKVSPNAKTAFSTDRLQNGVYIVKVKGLGIETSSKLIVKK